MSASQIKKGKKRREREPQAWIKQRWWDSHEEPDAEIDLCLILFVGHQQSVRIRGINPPADIPSSKSHQQTSSLGPCRSAAISCRSVLRLYMERQSANRLLSTHLFQFPTQAHFLSPSPSFRGSSTCHLRLLRATPSLVIGSKL